MRNFLRSLFTPAPKERFSATYRASVDGIEILVTRKPIRTLRLRLRDPQGPVLVSAPLRLSQRSIEAFVAERQAWIRKHLARMAAVPPKAAIPELSASEKREKAARLLHAAEALRPAREAALGVRASGIRIRSMRSRWGSCNIRSGQITLALGLADYGPEILDYILVHELAHLRELKHGVRFKALLTKHVPNWKLLQSELNRGPIL